jgi:hypothetical protein
VRSRFPKNKVAPLVTHKEERERIEFLEAKCIFLQSENDELYSSLKTQASEIDKIKQLLNDSEAMRRTLEQGLTETLCKARAEKITEERITIAEDRLLLNSQRAELYNCILSLQGKARGVPTSEASSSDATLTLELGSAQRYIDKIKSELDSATRAKRTAEISLREIRSLLTLDNAVIQNPMITRSGDIIERGSEKSGCFFNPKPIQSYNLTRIAGIVRWHSS